MSDAAADHVDRDHLREEAWTMALYVPRTCHSRRRAETCAGKSQNSLLTRAP